MAERKLLILLLSVFLIVAVPACGRQTKVDLYDIEHDMDGTGRVFLYAVVYGEEQLTISLLSARTQSAVAEHCENGEVRACFNNAGLQDWDWVEHIAFLPSYSHGSIVTYQITDRTGDTAILIVLGMVDENGEWRVDSWRGLMPFDGEILDGLIDGTDTTNLFPPEE